MFIVTELLVGETLRGRLTGAPMPLRKAIEIGRNEDARQTSYHGARLFFARPMR
jgi:hypothetical protein